MKNVFSYQYLLKTFKLLSDIYEYNYVLMAIQWDRNKTIPKSSRIICKYKAAIKAKTIQCILTLYLTLNIQTVTVCSEPIFTFLWYHDFSQSRTVRVCGKKTHFPLAISGVQLFSPTMNTDDCIQIYRLSQSPVFCGGNNDIRITKVTKSIY